MTSVSGADKCKLTLDNSEEDRKQAACDYSSFSWSLLSGLNTSDLTCRLCDFFKPFGRSTSLFCVCKMLSMLSQDLQKYLRCTLIPYTSTALPSIAVWGKHNFVVPKHRTTTIQHLARPSEASSYEGPTELFGTQQSPECKMY